MSGQSPVPSEDVPAEDVPAEDVPDQSISSSPSAYRPRERATVSVAISQRTLWLAAALVVAILAVILILTEALGPLILLLLSIIIGEAIRPLVARMERFRIPPPVAILLIYVIVLALVGLLMWLLLSPVVSQVTSLAHHLPEYQRELRERVTQLQRRLQAGGAVGQAIQNLAGSLAAALQHSAPALLALPFNLLQGIFGILISVVVILTMTLFWLLGSVKLKQFVVGLFPPAAQDHASLVITRLSRTFGGYVQGTALRMVLIGSLSGIGLAILQVPYALLLGVLAGLTELIPYLGPWISGSVAVLLALIAVGPGKAVEVIILFILIFEVEGNVVQPLVMSRTVHIDPLLVIVAVLIGLNLLGIIGAILAVPLAAALQVLVVQVFAPAIRRADSGAGLAAGSAYLATDSTAPPPDEPASPPPAQGAAEA
ncbi:MAG: AI-2E family transporter [Ktedonobacterales bacterium]